MGLEDTGDIPFSTVYLHGLLRDEKGEKMSKVRGNVVDPLDTIAKYGTDALRFALTSDISPGNDIKLTPSRLEAGRNFANKLWNATRFVVRSFEQDPDIEFKQDRLTLEDRWILSRLSGTIASVARLMANFQFGEAQRQLHDFLWGEFCDWYIEFAKIRLNSGEGPSPLPVLVHTLETSLRLLHPFMPFVTEELWQNLKQRLPDGWAKTESIMVADYPEADKKAIDPQAERVMEAVIEIVHAVRNARAEHKVESGRWVEAQVCAGGLTPAIAAYSPAIETLARARPVSFLESRREAPDENVLALVLKSSEVIIPMESMLDLKAERKRLGQEIAQTGAEVARLEARLKDKAFLTKAPPAVVAKERDKLAERKDRLERLKQSLDGLG
jgi:valyl-tRNA synthetase